MDKPTARLADYLTLRDVARALGGSYYSAYALAASGLLGEPITIGRTHLYARAIAEPAISHRRQQRRRSGSSAPLVERDER